MKCSARAQAHKSHHSLCVHGFIFVDDRLELNHIWKTPPHIPFFISSWENTHTFQYRNTNIGMFPRVPFVLVFLNLKEHL